MIWGLGQRGEPGDVLHTVNLCPFDYNKAEEDEKTEELQLEEELGIK